MHIIAVFFLLIILYKKIHLTVCYYFNVAGSSEDLHLEVTFIKLYSWHHLSVVSPELHLLFLVMLAGSPASWPGPPFSSCQYSRCCPCTMLPFPMSNLLTVCSGLVEVWQSHMSRFLIRGHSMSNTDTGLYNLYILYTIFSVTGDHIYLILCLYWVNVWEDPNFYRV